MDWAYLGVWFALSKVGAESAKRDETPWPPIYDGSLATDTYTNMCMYLYVFVYVYIYIYRYIHIQINISNIVYTWNVYISD